MRPIHAVAALAAAAGLTLAGCGSGGSSSDGSAAQPTGTRADAAQASAVPLDDLTSSVDVANAAILADGTGGASTRSDGATSVRADAPFTFNATGTAHVDLDATDGAGHDLHPNATGTFTVTWTGSVVASQPTGSGGVADYSVQVHADTDCVFTDPMCGKVATIAAGSSWSYSLEISWDKTDNENWTIDSTADLSATDFTASVVKGAENDSATINGHRHVTGHLGDVAGTLSASKTVQGHWTIDVDDEGVPHHIVWDRPSINTITITVDGTSYGPYTLAQARAILHCHIDDD